MDVSTYLAAQLQLPVQQVQRTLALLDEGNTIPFIARYRKEVTGGLDEGSLRAIAAGADKYRALAARKEEVLRLIGELGKLTPELAAAIEAATTLQEVDDLYRPYRPKRRTRADVAREQGLEPLAELLLQPGATWHEVERMAGAWAEAHAELAGATAALAGAADIVAERIADDAATRAEVRERLRRSGSLISRNALPPERQHERTPYEDYYEFSKAVRDLRPHQILALNRGEREGVLKVELHLAEEVAESLIRRRWVHTHDQRVADFLAATVSDAYKRLLGPSVEREVRNSLTEMAEARAIEVFARNLEALLMQPPVRGRRVLGVDPGYRAGCKLAVVDEIGRVLVTGCIYPHPPVNRRDEAVRTLQELIAAHRVSVVAIGNGTASRETEAVVADAISDLPDVQYLIVNEAGASVYSASPLAGEELPDLDPLERGTVSIARRVLDPLAELVKIEPKAIGVGQYQHDVNQKELARALDGVVESCVNRVGVHVNTASPALLKYVAGISEALACRIVGYRNANGPFRTRHELLQVKGLGPKTFEQAAGFLRISEGPQPLDGTAVHPESYHLAEAVLAAVGLTTAALRQPPAARERLRTLNAEKIAAQLGAGVPTVSDIIVALLQPGLDPRTELPPPPFRRDILHLEDLQPGMRLTGTVANVTDFGAFVDIGLKRAGLIHVSRMGQGYVKHPLDVVSVGEPVEVEVLEIDRARERISLALVR